jgi:hypothetical protein
MTKSEHLKAAGREHRAASRHYRRRGHEPGSSAAISEKDGGLGLAEGGGRDRPLALHRGT